MNPLANMFGQRQMPPKMNNVMNLMQQFNEFKNNFQGDPKQTVMNLLATGQMSQQQFQQLSQMANLFQNGMKR